MRTRIWLLCCIALVGAVAVIPCKAQWTHLPDWNERPDLWVNIQDTAWAFLVRPDDTVATIPPGGFSAGYQFQMLYDSTCITEYLFSECKQNGVRLRLPQWQKNRSVNANAKLLSWNSRTDTFTMHAGDTLSFYRELSWRNPVTQWRDTDSYYALDTLDYAVEIVRSSDSTRVGLLDSIGILPSHPQGVPRIYGTRPIMALVQYVVPPMLNGVRGFIRIRLFARGGGDYFFTRSDRVTYGISNRLTSARWMSYRDQYNQGFAARYAVQDLARLSSATGNARLDVQLAGGGGQEARITFTAPENARTAVAVYNALGEAIFYPYSGIPTARETIVQYRFPESGLYFVGLLLDGAPIITRKIIIH